MALNSHQFQGGWCLLRLEAYLQNVSSGHLGEGVGQGCGQTIGAISECLVPVDCLPLSEGVGQTALKSPMLAAEPMHKKQKRLKLKQY